MNPDDPFFPSKKANETLVKPMPGGRLLTPAASPTPEQTAHPSYEPESLDPLIRSGLNPIENLASQLLVLLVQLQSLNTQPDLTGLKQNTSRQLQQFQNELHKLGLDTQVVRAAHYAMCAVLDEAVLGTPWGGQSSWRESSLLSSFHQETWGGEQFFRLVEWGLQNPAGHRDLLEFLYICLALGFQGHFATLPNGASQLNQLRENLYQTVRAQRPEFERELSIRWRPMSVKSSPLSKFIPLWALAALSTGFLLLAYLAFSFSLNRDSDPLLADIYQLDGNDLAEFVKPVRTPSRRIQKASLTIQQLLAEEVAAGMLSLNEDARTVTILLAGDGLFDSGSARISEDHLDILQRVAESLAQVPGAILVTGHSDNTPIFSLKYPSNWHLSEERANSVVNYLVGVTGTPARFVAQGRADTEPLTDNNTAAGRAQNRRVEISLSPQKETSS